MSELTKEQQDERDRIRLLQYDNLRQHLNEDLIEPILGEKYYNMGQCVYSCDMITMQDLRSKFEKKDEELEQAKKIIKALFIAFVGMSLMFGLSVGGGLF